MCGEPLELAWFDGALHRFEAEDFCVEGNVAVFGMRSDGIGGGDPRSSRGSPSSANGSGGPSRLLGFAGSSSSSQCTIGRPGCDGGRPRGSPLQCTGPFGRRGGGGRKDKILGFAIQRLVPPADAIATDRHASATPSLQRFRFDDAGVVRSGGDGSSGGVVSHRRSRQRGELRFAHSNIGPSSERRRLFRNARPLVVSNHEAAFSDISHLLPSRVPKGAPMDPGTR